MKRLPLKNIIKGFTKLALVEVNAISKEPFSIDRWNICAVCPYNKKKVCSMCGCWIPAKVLLDVEYCPLKKWLQFKKDQQD